MSWRDNPVYRVMIAPRKSRWTLPAQLTAALVDPRSPEGAKALPYHSVYATFRKLLNVCGVGADAAKRPRLHDFRHSFATATLSRWYREDRDVQALLPQLPTHLGHCHISQSQVCSTL